MVHSSSYISHDYSCVSIHTEIYYANFQAVLNLIAIILKLFAILIFKYPSYLNVPSTTATIKRNVI